MIKPQTSHFYSVKRIFTVLAVATSFLVVAASGAQASQDDDSVKKLGAVICPDGNPCPALPAGAIDCTPKNGVVPKQCSWQPGQGDPADELKNLSPDNLPDMSVVVGAARSATTFSYSAVINALGKYAALELFYFDYGDGTGFGSSASLRSLTSFPTTHIYVQPGTYKIVGYGRFEGKTESASMTIVVPPASAPDPTPDKVDSTDWAPAKTPAANAVIPVTSTSSSSSADLSIGTGGKTISEATSAAPSTSEKKAPGVDAKANQVVIVSVPSLPAGADVSGKVKVGKTWRTLPTVEVLPGSGGVQVAPGKAVAIIDGKVVDLTVVINEDNSALVEYPNRYVVRILPTRPEDAVITADGATVLRIYRSRTVAIQGQGFAKATEIEVWINSTPIKIGNIMTDSEGAFNETLSLSQDIALGDHTLTLSGVLADGSLSKTSIGAIVVDVDDDDVVCVLTEEIDVQAIDSAADEYDKLLPNDLLLVQRADILHADYSESREIPSAAVLH